MTHPHFSAVLGKNSQKWRGVFFILVLGFEIE